METKKKPNPFYLSVTPQLTFKLHWFKQKIQHGYCILGLFKKLLIKVGNQ